MSKLDEFTALDTIDLLLILCGLTLTALGAFRWRRAWPRDPLRNAPIRPNVLSAAWMWQALLFYALATIVASAAASRYKPAGLDPSVLSMQQSILAGNIQLVLLSLASVWILRQTSVGGLRSAGLGRNPLWPDLLTSLKGFLVAFSLCTLIALLTEILIGLLAPGLDLQVHTVFETLHHPATSRFIGLVAISGACLLAPVGEELFFRGIIQTGLRRVLFAKPGSMRHRWLAIAIASALFAVLHLPVVQHVPALFVLALILGYYYERTGSLVVPIIVHMLFNTKSILWLWLGA